MNACPEKEPFNPWLKREEFAKIPARTVIFSMLIVFLCALAMPLALFYETISLLILAALFAYVAAIVKTPASVTLLLITAFAIVSLTQSFAIGALFLSLVVGTGATAFLFTAMERSYILLLLPTAACAASYAVLGDWGISLLAFAFLPAAILLAVATRLGKNRTSAICFAEGGLLLVILGVSGYLLYTYSQRAGVPIAEYVDRLREKTVLMVMESLDEAFRTLEDLGNEEALGALAEFFSEENIRTTIDAIFNILPASCCIFCGIVAFEAQLLLNASYRTVGWKQVLTPSACVFTMSLPAAVIYFVCFVISLIAWDYNLVIAVIENLYLILLPGFCVIGVTMLMLSFARSKGNGKMIWIVFFAAFFCCCASGTAIPLLALMGANSVILGTMRQRMLEKMKQNGTPFGGDDHEDGNDNDPES